MSEPKGIHAAMVKIMKEVDPIGKTKKEGISYPVRSIDDVYNAVHEIISENGVHCVTNEIVEMPSPGKFIGRKYTFRFYHTDGSFVDCKGEGASYPQSDYDATYPGKAQSYADKYALITALKITIPGMDDSEIQTKHVSTKEIDKLNAQISGNQKEISALKKAIHRMIGTMIHPMCETEDQADDAFKKIYQTLGVPVSEGIIKSISDGRFGELLADCVDQIKA